MDKLKTIRVRGNTIVETIVALTVISILFGIATTFCVRLMTGTASMKKIRAANLLQLYADRTVTDKEFFDAVEPVNGLLLVRQVGSAAGPGDLINIHFSVVDSNKTVLSDWYQLIRDEK
jgi:hypothetical protein